MIHSSTGGFRCPDCTFQATADTGDTLSVLSCTMGEVAKQVAIGRNKSLFIGSIADGATVI